MRRFQNQFCPVLNKAPTKEECNKNEVISGNFQEVLFIFNCAGQEIHELNSREKAINDRIYRLRLLVAWLPSLNNFYFVLI